MTNLKLKSIAYLSTIVIVAAILTAFNSFAADPVDTPQPADNTVKNEKSKKPDFGPYIANMQSQIYKNWIGSSKDRKKTVALSFNIDRAGKLFNETIQQTSGYDTADQSALDAVRKSAPFPPFPEAYQGQDIHVQFIFDYKVYLSRHPK